MKTTVSDAEKRKLEEWEDKMAKAEQQLENSRTRHDGKEEYSMNAEDVTHILENQFRILDHLDGLARKVEHASSSSSSSSTGTYSPSVTGDVADVERKVDDLR